MPVGLPSRCSDEARERRRLERAYVRRHHPDVGGDPAAFAAGLTALRAELGHAGRPAGVDRVIVVRSRGPRAWLRRLLGPRPARRSWPLR
jgi:hypothetical protein